METEKFVNVRYYLNAIVFLLFISGDRAILKRILSVWNPCSCILCRV